MSALRGIVHPTAGPLVPVVLRQSFDAEETTAFEAHGYAIIDTGATLSGIDEDLAIRLKLPPLDTLQLTRPGPAPDFTAARFHGEIAFPGTQYPDFRHALVGYPHLDTRIAEAIRVVALLGRDWLADARLIVHGARALEVHRL
jgi:hypothetical protein